MFTNKQPGTKDAGLQATLVALHKAHYHVHEDVVGIFLHDDFLAEALRGDYYATSYLRHRLPLLFRLALCKWRPHRRAPQKAGPRNQEKISSADHLSFRGGSLNDSDGCDRDVGCCGSTQNSCSTTPNVRHSRRRRHHLGGSPCGSSTEQSNFSTPAAEGCSGGGNFLMAAGDASISDDSQRETWSPEHTTPAPSPPAATSTNTGAAAKDEVDRQDGLTREQQMQLSILALRVLCGDRSRVREGSAEAVTATCGLIWDIHTVRSFYDDHRRLVRWTCRVLHASCEWVEDVVRRAVEDELIEHPSQAPMPSSTPTAATAAASSLRPPRAPHGVGGLHSPLRPLSENSEACGGSASPPSTPPHLPRHSSASGAAASVSPSHVVHPPPPPSFNARTTFASTEELEASLELHCRRIRHALMVLESLLVSLVLVQSYIYRTQPGRSNTPPWLRRKSSSCSNSSELDANGTDAGDNESDDNEELGRTQDNNDNRGTFFRGDDVGGVKKCHRRRHKRTSKNGGLRNSTFELRTDTCSSFDTDSGGEEGHDEAYIMQMEAEADEPPLELLVRHCLHAFTRTFLSITAVQQQLQEYSHERRHAAPAVTPTAASNLSFAGVSATTSTDACSSPQPLPMHTAGHDERGLGDAVSPVTPFAPTELEASSLVAARGTAAAYACPRCQRFHAVEEVLLVAANDNLEVLKKSAIAFAANHSAIAEESIRVIDAEGAVFTSQATMLLAHVLTPDLLAAHPPGSRGGMALEWVLNYVFGGCSGADVRQHQQQEQQHIAGADNANSFDCFSLANSSFSSTNPQSVDASDQDGRSSDGGWRSLGGDQSDVTESGHSSAQSSGKWNVNRFEYSEDLADSPVLYNTKNDNTDGVDEAAQPQGSSETNAQDAPENQTSNMRVEYILAACFTRCHPLMTVIGLVAENNQYNCGRTVAQAVLQYAFTLAQTSARLLRTPLLTNTWSTPFTEVMMRGLSELAAHAHPCVSVTPTVAQPGGAGGGGAAAGPAAGAFTNLTWSFASSSSPALAVTAASGPLGPPQLTCPDHSFAPLLAAQLNVPTYIVSSAMRQMPRPKPYAFTPPPAAVVTGATPADDSEAAQVRTMRRCLALHWAKCVLLSARTLTRAGICDVSVPFEHYVNLRHARLQLRERMMAYHDRMREHFQMNGNTDKVKLLDDVFERWEADERRMSQNDLDIADDPNGSFTTATAPCTVHGTPVTPALYTADPLGHVSPAPTHFVGGGGNGGAGGGAAHTSDPQTAEGSAVPSHFDSSRNTHTMTATVAAFAMPSGANSRVGAASSGSADPKRDQLWLPQPEDSSFSSAGPDQYGRSFDGATGAALTEKESYRRAFVDSFCFGKSDFELLSAALLDKSRTAVQVPIHVIVCTSLFSILDAMGDVLLCEKPRLSSVVANELLTLLYEAQLSMLEPLHDGAMAVVGRETSSTSESSSSSASVVTSPESSLCSLPVVERPDGRRSDTSDDSFTSPGSLQLPSAAASSSCSAASSVTLSSDGSGSSSPPVALSQSAPVDNQKNKNNHNNHNHNSRSSKDEHPGPDQQSTGSCKSSSDGEGSDSGKGTNDLNHNSKNTTGGGDGDGGDNSEKKAEVAKKNKDKKSRKWREESVTITRDGHILLFNEYALLLEAGLRTPLVVRRWRNEALHNPNHPARGYLSLLDHLQFRQSQWAEPSQEEYLVSRSTLRLMLGVTARDARGNLHGNILHVDDLDVTGSRKEEVAPRLGVTSSKDSMTMTYSEEWDPSLVDPAEAQAQKSSFTEISSNSNSTSSDQVGRSTRPSADSMGHGCSQNHSADAAFPHKDDSDAAVSVAAAAVTADGGGSGVGGSSARVQRSNGESLSPLKSPVQLGRRPLLLSSTSLVLSPTQNKPNVMGSRTSSFECVSLLGTRLETWDDGTPLQALQRSPSHPHHHDRLHSFVEADDPGEESECVDDVDLDEEDRYHDRHRHDQQHSDDSTDEDEGHVHCAECATERSANHSPMSANTYGVESQETAAASATTTTTAVPHQQHYHQQPPPHLTQEGHAIDYNSSGSPTVNSSSCSSSSSSHAHYHHSQTHSHSHGDHHGHHGHHGHGGHVRPPYAPWRHVPTRVTLVGVQGDLETMVKRMPYTWTLAEPLEKAVGEARGLTEKEGASRPLGDGAPAASMDASTANSSTTPGSVLYTPVYVVALSDAPTTARTKEMQVEQHEVLSNPAVSAAAAAAPTPVEKEPEANASTNMSVEDKAVVEAAEGSTTAQAPAREEESAKGKQQRGSAEDEGKEEQEEQQQEGEVQDRTVDYTDTDANANIGFSTPADRSDIDAADVCLAADKYDHPGNSSHNSGGGAAAAASPDLPAQTTAPSTTPPPSQPSCTVVVTPTTVSTSSLQPVDVKVTAMNTPKPVSCTVAAAAGPTEAEAAAAASPPSSALGVGARSHGHSSSSNSSTGLLPGPPSLFPPHSGTMMSGSAPLGIGSSPSCDAALSRAIHRVLRHRKSASTSSDVLPASLTSLNNELARSLPCSPSPLSPALAGATTVELITDPRRREGGTSESNNSSNNSVSLASPAQASHRGSQRPKRHQQPAHSNMSDTAAAGEADPRAALPRDIWDQTLSKLRQMTAVSSPHHTRVEPPLTALWGKENAKAAVAARSPERAAVDKASNPLDEQQAGVGADAAVEAHDPLHRKQKSRYQPGDVVRSPRHGHSSDESGSSNDGGGVRRALPPCSTRHISSTSHGSNKNASGSSSGATDAATAAAMAASRPMEALQAQGSTDTMSPNSPSTSESAPHDLQWYTGGNSAAYRPPRSTVSAEDPMSPTVTGTSRFSVEEGSSSGSGLTAQVTAEGVIGSIRIGQGVGKSRLWSAVGHVRQRSPPPERLNGASRSDSNGGGGALQSTGVMDANALGTSSSVKSATLSDPCSPDTSTVTAVPGMQHSSRSDVVGGTERETYTSAGVSGNANNKACPLSATQTPPTVFVVPRSSDIGRGSSGGSEGRPADARAPVELSQPCAMLNGKTHMEGERGVVGTAVPYQMVRQIHYRRDSSLNNRHAGTTSYASSNDSDVST
ncbi:hypothetical protein N2W54_000438 [Lotmaria passim]